MGIELCDFFRTNAEYHLAIAPRAQLFLVNERKKIFLATAVQLNAVYALLLPHLARNKIHRRRSHEPGDKHVHRLIVNFLWRTELHHFARFHHRDFVAQGHRFDLIVGDVDDGRTETLMKKFNFGTAETSAVKATQGQLGIDHVGALVEATLAKIAVGLVGLGVRQLVVAGGETSGACVLALAVHLMKIGPQIDPGVPWCHATCAVAGSDGLHLSLKSGNFGADDFFTKAFAALP